MTAFSRVAVAFLLLTISIPVFAAEAPSLSMTVTETGVTVSGVTAGGEVVLFSFAKRVRNDEIYLERQGRVLDDADRDSVVTLAEKVPLRSVWIAVDQKSGAVATGARSEWEPHVTTLSMFRFRKDDQDEITALENEIPRLEVLLVRPGLGAWLMAAVDGSSSDRDDEANGKVRIAFEDAPPLIAGKEKGPKHLKAGDVIAAVDPGRLDIFIGQVTK